MKLGLAWMVVGVGCLVGCIDGEAPMDPILDDPDVVPLVADANGCHGVAVLHGANAEHVDFGPHAFGQGTFCLTLDTTENRYGHLMISTQSFAGTHAPIALELRQAGATVPLATSTDITVGVAEPVTFASIEMAMTMTRLLDAQLVVTGEGADVETAVSISLFERLE